LNLLFLNLHKSGFNIAQIFYGTWFFPLGYLVYKSGFLTKWFGILLMVDWRGVKGTGVLTKLLITGFSF